MAKFTVKFPHNNLRVGQEVETIGEYTPDMETVIVRPKDGPPVAAHKRHLTEVSETTKKRKNEEA